MTDTAWMEQYTAHLPMICEKLSEGVTMRAICRQIGIGESMIRYWLSKDDESRKAVAAARELGCDALVDECIEIADEDASEPVQVSRNKMRIDARLRIAGKWSQRYADRQLLGGLDGGALVVNIVKPGA